MRASESRPVTVTLAEIARIAGVGRAAVSNWRRRRDDFPSPVGGSDASPQFDLTQVRSWLLANDKVKRLAELDWLWPEFEALGSLDSMGSAIAQFGRLLLEGNPGEAPHGEKQLQPIVLRALEVAEDSGAKRTFDFLNRRFMEAHVRQITMTPDPMARLMADVANAFRKGRRTETVLDPACGVGELLMAAVETWASEAEQLADFRVHGQDNDPVLAELAEVRLLLASSDLGAPARSVRVLSGDSLLDDRFPKGDTDVVLCHPPSNEHEWGQAALSTDSRWVFGLPPRTEPELAWVQHVVARLAPGGTAVLLLPPLVSSRRAGRRIRAGLVRSGILRSVISLPPGCAPPHSLSLHLWVLSVPVEDRPTNDGVLFVDTATGSDPNEADIPPSIRHGVDWERLRIRILSALSAGADTPRGCARVSVIDLLDEQTDLTPARRIPTPSLVTGATLRRSWTRLETALDEIRDISAELTDIPLDEEEAPDVLSLDDLVQAKAVLLRNGQLPPDELVRVDPLPEGDAVRLRTIASLTGQDAASRWIDGSLARSAERQGMITLTSPGDVVVSGSSRWFDAWVDTEAPTAIGAQLFVLTPTSDLDSWFLAGCLRSPRNARLADTHTTSSSSRVDVRRLTLPRLPFARQQEYGQLFRRLHTLQRAIAEVGGVGRVLDRGLHDALASGGLRTDGC